jgi:hypothetical protein
VDSGGDRRDEQVAVERVHLKPRQTGNGLALPPLVPMVAVVFAFAGLAVGFRLGATAPVASSTSSPAAARTTAAAAQTTAAAELTAAAQAVEAGSGVWYVYEAGSPFPGLATISITSRAEAPPTGGLTLEAALAILDSGRIPMIPTSSHVIYARAVRLGDVDPGGHPASDPVSADTWVWAIAIPSLTISTDDPSSQPLDVEGTAEMIVLDYRTGALIETFWMPLP